MGLAVAGMGFLAGCVISIDGSCDRPKPRSGPSSGATISGDTTIAEIEAVCRLPGDADRHDLLAQIAGRPSLSPPAQVHLVKMTRERLGSDRARMDVLMVLAENPALHEEGIRALIAATDSLGSSADRRAVLEAVGRRQARPPMPGPVPPVPSQEAPPPPVPVPY